jgi:hypothetical protein
LLSQSDRRINCGEISLFQVRSAVKDATAQNSAPVGISLPRKIVNRTAVS